MPDAKEHATESFAPCASGATRPISMADACAICFSSANLPTTTSPPMRLPARSCRFSADLAVGEQFGVVLVPTQETCGTRTDGAADASNTPDHHRHAVEVATFRSDVGYSDGRHPDEVRFTKDPREDVQRRDFTINGMCSIRCRDRDEGFSTSLVAVPISRQESFAPSATRAPICRRQTAHAARGALRGALRLQIDPATMAAIQKLGAANPPGLKRARPRRTDQDAYRRPRAAAPSSCSTRAACCAKCCPKFRP